MNKRVKKVGMLEKKKRDAPRRKRVGEPCRTKEFQENDSRLPLHDCFS
jgi:hypothetical protein